jgi:hypothetical protein
MEISEHRRSFSGIGIADHIPAASNAIDAETTKLRRAHRGLLLSEHSGSAISLCWSNARPLWIEMSTDVLIVSATYKELSNRSVSSSLGGE